MATTKEAPTKDPSTGRFVSSKTTLPDGQEPPEPMQEPKKPDPDKKVETPEELAGLRSMASRLLGIEDTDEEWGDKKKEVPVEKKSPVTKAKVKPAVIEQREEPQKLNTSELPKLIAEAVATAIKKPEDAKQPEKEQVSEEEAFTLSVLKEMEGRWPKKYGNLVQRYSDTQKALVGYAKKWVADHPGQDFNEDDAEHEEFYKNHDVDWDDHHFNAALARIEARQEHESIEKNIREKYDKKLDALESDNRLRNSAQSIAQEQTTAAKAFWQQFNGEYAGILKEDGEFDLDKLATLKESDQEGLTIRAQVGRSLEQEVAELYKLMGNPDEPEYKPFSTVNMNDPIHQRLDEFGSRKQRELVAEPKEQRLDEQGRDFLPIVDYWKLTKEQRVKHWTFTARDLALLRAAELAANAQRFLDQEEERFTSRAKKRGLIKDDSTPQARTRSQPEVEEDPDNTNGKPTSPSSSPSSRMAAAREKGGGHQKTGIDRFIEDSIAGR